MSLEHAPSRKDGRVDPMLRPREVCSLMGWSRTTLWRRCRAGTFPPPTELGPNAIGWSESVAKAARDALPQRTYGAETPYEPAEGVVT
jgi:predicted DNA-binding transcriptional regulator AlpA